MTPSRPTNAVSSLSFLRLAGGLAFGLVSGCGGLVTEGLADGGGSSVTGGQASVGGADAAGGAHSGGAQTSSGGGLLATGGALSAEFAAVGGSGAQSGDLEAQLARQERVQGYWEHDKPLPVDERPDPPPWNAPSFVSASSAQPLCLPFANTPDLKGIHADGRGLFVAVARTCLIGLEDSSSVCDSAQGSALYHYAHGSWNILALPSYTVEPMVGTIDGPLFFGPDVAFDPASGASVLLHPFAIAQGAPTSKVVSAGSATYLLAWSAKEPSGTTTIARFDGSAWVPNAIAGATWPLLGSDRSGAIYLEHDNATIAGIPPALTDFSFDLTDRTEIRGNSRDDLWISQPNEVFHYETNGDPFGATVALTQIEAGETRLFGFSGSTFGYVSYLGWTEIATLDVEPLRYFQDLAVVSDNEVYIAMRDDQLDEYKCGGLVILKYDGTVLTRL